MKDLFEIFPDLPCFRRRSLAERLARLRGNAEVARRRMDARVHEQQALARRIREAWRTTRGIGVGGRR